MAVQIRVRRGTAAQWTIANPTLDEGEVGVETDTSKLKVGDGVTVWTSLAYQGPSDPIVDISAVEKGGVVVGSAVGEIVVLPVGADGTVLGVNPSDTTTVGWVTFDLDALSDVVVSAPTAGSLLQFNGSSWVNVTDVSVLTANRDALVALVWGAAAGYFSRGSNDVPVYRWSFPSDTVATVASTPATMTDHSGFYNPSVAGYFARGGGTSTVYKYQAVSNVFSQTTSAPGGMWWHAGFANPAVFGYFSASNNTTPMYKWSFPLDTASTTTSVPDVTRRSSGFSNPGVAGYLNRGYNGSFGETSTVYKWSFPAETVSTTTSLPATVAGTAAISNPAVAGYVVYFGSCFKLTFPSDTASTTTSPAVSISSGWVQTAGFANPAIAGYFSEANTSARVVKYTFPSDVSSLTTSAPNTMATFNGGGHGGFANG